MAAKLNSLSPLRLSNCAVAIFRSFGMSVTASTVFLSLTCSASESQGTRSLCQFVRSRIEWTPTEHARTSHRREFARRYTVDLQGANGPTEPGDSCLPCELRRSSTRANSCGRTAPTSCASASSPSCVPCDFDAYTSLVSASATAAKAGAGECQKNSRSPHRDSHYDTCLPIFQTRRLLAGLRALLWPSRSRARRYRPSTDRQFGARCARCRCRNRPPR